MSVRGHRGGWFAAVADGLGSRALSHVGSRLAVQVAHRALNTLPSEPRDAIQQFYRSWLRALPDKAPGAMATTLLAAHCQADGHCRIAQLGDGLALYRAGGVFGVLTPSRAGFGNETDALGITRSFAAWHTTCVVLSEPGDGVLLMTDGLADDLLPERLKGFFSHLIRMAESRSRRNGMRWLEGQLKAWPTALHTDDKSIALIFRDGR